MDNPSVCFVHTARGNRHDFRVSGLPHAVVKQAENFRVRELVKKIESQVIVIEKHFKPMCNKITPDNPLSDESKAMIREMGNVELFELCEPIPKVQCSECLLCWNQEILHCTCGHLLVETNPAKIFTMATRCFLNPALRHQNGMTSWCSARQH